MIMSGFVRLKMHSIYDHFPERNPVEGEPFIDCYNDSFVLKVRPGETAIALLLEPRSLVPDAYEFCEEHPDLFKIIFTHDTRLLRLPNARLFLWADVWPDTYPAEKTKGISIVSSWKNWCPLHDARMKLTRLYENDPMVDTFGSWKDGKSWDTVKDYLSPYKFSIIIENDWDFYWYTEKILNCFATKTVPIYLGGGRVKELYNPKGIIYVTNWHDIPGIINGLNIDKMYEAMLPAVEDNFQRVEPLRGITWKDKFWGEYESLLQEVQDGKM